MPRHEGRSRTATLVDAARVKRGIERAEAHVASTIIADQEAIDAAVARAEAATPLGIRSTSPGGLRVVGGQVFVAASFPTTDKYRAALTRELQLVDPRAQGRRR